MVPTSDARPVYHGADPPSGEPPGSDPPRVDPPGSDPPEIPAEQYPDLYALWGELETANGSGFGTIAYVVAMPDGRTYSISAEDDPRSFGLDGVGSHHNPEGAADLYHAVLIRLVPMRPLN